MHEYRSFPRRSIVNSSSSAAGTNANKSDATDITSNSNNITSCNNLAKRLSVDASTMASSDSSSVLRKQQEKATAMSMSSQSDEMLNLTPPNLGRPIGVATPRKNKSTTVANGTTGHVGIAVNGTGATSSSSSAAANNGMEMMTAANASAASPSSSRTPSPTTPISSLPNIVSSSSMSPSSSSPSPSSSPMSLTTAVRWKPFRVCRAGFLALILISLAVYLYSAENRGVDDAMTMHKKERALPPASTASTAREESKNSQQQQQDSPPPPPPKYHRERDIALRDPKLYQHTALSNPSKHFTSPPPHQIKRIAHLGERNSGTRWIFAELKSCFPNISIQPRLLRWKHWFQTYDGGLYGSHRYTLVISQFRNPYEWMEAMRHVPHHAPNHALLDWKGFVTKEWSMDRPVRDLQLASSSFLVQKNNQTLLSREQICYDKFAYNEVISCVEGTKDDVEYRALFDSHTGLNRFGYNSSNPHDFSAHKPIYELDPTETGKPFANILRLRSAKIENFLSTKHWPWVADVIPIQYEQLLTEGTEKLISLVERMIGQERQCVPSGPQKQRARRVIDPRMIEYINQHLNWTVEERIGYEKWPAPSLEDVKEYDERIRSGGDGSSRSRSGSSDARDNEEDEEEEEEYVSGDADETTMEETGLKEEKKQRRKERAYRRRMRRKRQMEEIE